MTQGLALMVMDGLGCMPAAPAISFVKGSLLSDA
jgi:hypothetical protein